MFGVIHRFWPFLGMHFEPSERMLFIILVGAMIESVLMHGYSLAHVIIEISNLVPIGRPGGIAT